MNSAHNAVSGEATMSDEEWVISVKNHARYIHFCDFDGTYCQQTMFYLRRVAAFSAPDPCLANVTFGAIS